MPKISISQLIAVVALTVVITATDPAAQAADPGRPRLGINLANIADWETELPFKDAFKSSRPWISQKRGLGYNQGPALDLDRRGWVRRLEADCYAETYVCSVPRGRAPSGDYEILYQGKGRLVVAFAPYITVVGSEPGRITIRVDGGGKITLRIMETNPTDYIRNIRVLFPGESPGGSDFESPNGFHFDHNPWRADFLDRWRGVASLRFMNWMRITGSPQEHWEDRPTRADATYSGKGVPLEVMIDLANRLMADPWFNIPHQADDEYVEEFARVVHDRLDPRLRAHIEWSNETWNDQFPQYKYAAARGLALGLAGTPWEAAWRYTSRRSVEVFEIFEDVFGGTDRLVRVLPSQAGSPFTSNVICGFEDAYRHADALAIAPYIPMILTPARLTPVGKPSAEEVSGWSPDQVLDYVEAVSLPQSVKNMQQSAAVAAKYGLALVAYEGGQHLVGARGGEHVSPLTDVLRAANAHPRMGAIYDEYFAAWQAAGGDLFCHYNSVSVWTGFGSWGCLQYANDDPASSPKFLALVRWGACWNPSPASTLGSEAFSLADGTEGSE